MGSTGLEESDGGGMSCCDSLWWWVGKFQRPVGHFRELIKQHDEFREAHHSGCSVEGVCSNYRDPATLHGEPRVCSAPHVAFPADPLDPVDAVESSGEFREAQIMIML